MYFWLNFTIINNTEKILFAYETSSISFNCFLRLNSRIRVTGSICRQFKGIYTYYHFCFPSDRLYLLIHPSLLNTYSFTHPMLSTLKEETLEILLWFLHTFVLCIQIWRGNRRAIIIVCCYRASLLIRKNDWKNLPTSVLQMAEIKFDSYQSWQLLTIPFLKKMEHRTGIFYPFAFDRVIFQITINIPGCAIELS